MNQGELADALGLSRASIALYESGSRNPKMKTLMDMAALFGCSTDVLTGKDIHKDDLPKDPAFATSGVVLIPVVNNVFDSLYGNSEADENCPGIFVSRKLMLQYSKAVACRAASSNMKPFIDPDDTLIIVPAVEIANGDTVILSTGNDKETVIGKIHFDNSKLVLDSVNTDFQTRAFSMQEVDNLPVLIVGKIVEIRKNL